MRFGVVLYRAPRFLRYACILLCCAPTSGYPHSKALVTEYLECIQDNKGRDIASRSMPTPVFHSKQGFRAYGVVVANLSPEGVCKNTSTVYLADPSRSFRVAFQQTPEPLPDGTVYDGNGIERIQWSPSGTRLLIGVSQWTWGTDSTWNKKYIVLTGSEGSAKELPIKDAIRKYFAQPCAWLSSSKGWLDDTRIDIEINPYKDVDEEGAPGPTRSCVQKPTQFTFDVDSGEFRNWR